MERISNGKYIFLISISIDVCLADTSQIAHLERYILYCAVSKINDEN